MSLKVYKNITIDNFMKLWEDIQAQNWGKVFPDWHQTIIKVWNNEVKQKFTMLKRANSYGKVDFENAAILKTLQNTKITYLPRFKPYRWDPKLYKDPHTYVEEGDLKSKFSNMSQYDHIATPNKIGVRLNIPRHPLRKDAYMELEESRSIFKASFVLSWPEIIRKTLEGVGK